MKSIKVLILVLLTLLLTSIVAAQEGGGANINGLVTNNSPNGAVPYGAPVTLQFFEESEWTTIYTSTIKNDGTFQFTGLESELNNDFITRIEYGDAEYFSEPAVFEGDLDVEIFIFEPTEDLSAVRVDQAHFFIVPSSETVSVAEFYLLGNGGEKTYIGTVDSVSGMRTTVNFSLPEDALNVTFDGPGLGERFIGSEQNFADTRGIPPGNATIEVGFVYELQQSNIGVIERMMEIPVESVVFIVSGGEIGIQGSGLEFSGVMDTQMGPAASYTAGPLEAYESLSFSFIPLEEDQVIQPSEPTPDRPSIRTRDAGRESIIGIVILAVAGFTAYQMWQSPAYVKMPDSAREYVTQIAELDDSFENGEIDKTTYQTKRAALKHRVKSMIRKH